MIDWDLLWKAPLITSALVVAYGMGRYFSPPSISLPMHERLELMNHRVKHSTGVLILGGLIALAVITFAGAVDIQNPTIAALVVQFLNTIKDLAMGPSLHYFPRASDKTERGDTP